jgi:hypothetical protein
MGIALTPADLFKMNPLSLMRRITEQLDRTVPEVSGGEKRERVWAPAIEVIQG